MGLNLQITRQIFADSLSKPKYIDIAYDLANTKFENDKNNLLEAVKEHPVSEELNDGERADNTTETLDTKGNLFSFIGFDKGTHPVQEVLDILDHFITIRKKRPKADYQKDIINYDFFVYLPTKEDIYNNTPMPRGTAKSFVWAIENGIPGVDYYLYSETREFPTSHSGPAIQIDNSLGERNYKPIGYVTPLLEQFIQKYK